jgi:hypothetical protein
MAGSPATPEGRGCARDGRVNFKRSRSKQGGMMFVAVGVILTAMRLMPHP